MHRLYFSWERFPALFIFASLISGAMLFVGIYPPLFFAFTHKNHLFKVLYLLLACFSAALFVTDSSEKPKNGLVVAYIEPMEIKESNHRMFMAVKIPYLKTEDGKEYRKIKAIIPFSNFHQKINSHYIVTGDLKESTYGYTLLPKSWKKVEKTFSLTEKRFFLKKYARKIIKDHTRDEDVFNYFSALVTATISDPFLKQSFLEAGMLHTLAISGFHFSWILFLFSIPLTLIFSKKHAMILLLILGWLYFLFLGPQPSISRAWISISIFILALLFSKVPLSLNALGSCGIISLILDPYCVFELSFALSFLATFAILTLHPFISQLANLFCRKREKNELLKMPFIHKCGYFPLRFFLSSFFLSLLIQIVLLPVLIHFFPFFSLWSLFFNIFFPFSMILTIILLLLSFTFYPIFECSLLWKINEEYSKIFLETILYGKGFAPLLMKLGTVNPQLLSIFGSMLIFFCLIKEKLFHEESLIIQDDSS